MIIKEAYQNLVNAISSYYGIVEAKSIARIVFEDVFGVYNFQKVEALSEDQKIKFEDIRQRLINKEPVQYILGQADFYGLKFKVNSHTLIPRQETEELVYWILATIKEQKIGKASILDIGTGTGCIPITLKVKNQLLASKGLDISEEAVELAIENAKLNRVEVLVWREIARGPVAVDDVLAVVDMPVRVFGIGGGADECDDGRECGARHDEEAQSC